MAEEINKDEKQKVKSSFKRKNQWMYNRFIVKNIPFYFFISAMALVYIANGHYADKTMRKINETEKNLKEMEYEFKTVKQEVIFEARKVN